MTGLLVVKDVELLVGKPLGLTDEAFRPGKSVRALRVIDITALCPGEQVQAVIMFALLRKYGPIAQLCRMQKKDRDISTRHWFALKKLSQVKLATDPYIVRRWADPWQIKPIDLARIVFGNVPSSRPKSVVQASRAGIKMEVVR